MAHRVRASAKAAEQVAHLREIGGIFVSLVVGVHGIAQQRKGEDVLQQEWGPPLLSGLRRAGAVGARARDRLGVDSGRAALDCAFYGDLFRPPGRPLGVGDPFLTAADATDDEAELLALWWREAARVDDHVPSPDAKPLSTPQAVQRALNALSRSRVLAGVAERALLFDLRQVRLYMGDPQVRMAVQSRVVRAVTVDTQVIVAHSLGSVVAYEALCAHPEWGVHTLITVGSPLGIRNLIFDKLAPLPDQSPGPGTAPGHWPGTVTTWVNIADAGDVVALVKDLRPLFATGVQSPRRFAGWLVDNGTHAHDVVPYLTAEQTGRALAEALARSDDTR